MSRPTISAADLGYISRQLGIRWDRVRYCKEDLRQGLLDELDITEKPSDSELLEKAHIVISNLESDPDYYREWQMPKTQDAIFVLTTWDLIIMIIAFVLLAFIVKINYKYSILGAVLIGVGSKFI